MKSLPALVTCLILCVVQMVHAEPFRGYTYYKDNGPSSGLATEGKTLTLNGKPLRILSGSVHYFRVVPQYWEDRLQKLKAAGLNTVETYVPWNLHEPQPGVFNFDGILDLVKFIETAKKLDLLVIFRPGPYICAEWEFGGLPSWLLQNPDMKVRTNTPPYMNATSNFLKELIPKIKDLQFTKNGPIFLVQVENEYGAYGGDTAYMDASKAQLRELGIEETLVTSDGPKDLESGKATDVWMTVNEKNDMGQHLDKLANLQKDKPLMVMEYWSGWFDHWTETHNTISVDKFALELRAILSRNASVNFYVFHGGTTFGFLNGANFALSNPNVPYEPDITSYDYDALVSEAGNLTPKWHKTKEIFKEFGLLADDLPEPPAPMIPFAYGRKNVEKWLPLSGISMGVKAMSASSPVPMEQLEIFPALPVSPLAYNTTSVGNQSYGYVLYSIDIANADATLTLPELHDRALILFGDSLVKVVEYTESAKQSHVVQLLKRNNGNPNTLSLQILVENMGRANYARKDTLDSDTLNRQWKGMKGQVLLNSQAITNWIVYPLQFNKGGQTFLSSAWQSNWKTDFAMQTYPSLMQLTLNITDENPRDTFLDVTGWGRGVVFVNDINIGRFWPDKGPQQTLYVPGPLLKKGANTVLLFELEKSATYVTFTDIHRLDKSSPTSSGISSLIPKNSTLFFFAVILVKLLM